MSKKSLISVVMSLYNEELNWAKESIESILKQTYNNIEFIIILDNPNREDLKALLKEYSKKDSRLRYFINSKNQGLIYSLNRALKECSGSYIARMDGDDISHKDRLQKQLNYLLEKNLDLLGSNINMFNEDGIFATTNKLLTHKYIKKLLYRGTIDIVHPTFFAKKELFIKLDGYKNALHAEDKDFLARAICANYIVGNSKDILLDCRYSNKSITKESAIYVYKVGAYITKVFKNCLQTKKYDFDYSYCSNLHISKEEIDNFSKKQIYLSCAKDALHKKRYLEFLSNLLKALRYSKTIFATIKVHLFAKYYKFLETLALKFRGDR